MVKEIGKVTFILAAIFLFSITDSYAADLKTLMEIGASQADIAKSLAQETTQYNGVKDAVNAGAIKEGMAADSVRKKYGNPIIETYDKKKDVTKWLYMPATSSHFKGEKLYLYVNNDNKIAGWELLQ